jgi:hypothetical protein
VFVLLLCRGNVVLRDVVVGTNPLLTLQCKGSTDNTVAALNPGSIACTGSYAVTHLDLEAGQLTFTAQANSTTLEVASTPIDAITPVVLIMAAQPQLDVDVVASSCVVLNATSKPLGQHMLELAMFMQPCLTPFASPTTACS